MVDNLSRELILTGSTSQHTATGQKYPRTFRCYKLLYNIQKMSSEKALKEENDRLYEKIRKLEEDMQANEHQQKLKLIEAKTKLEFQTARAEEYEEKYKSILQYKNQEESLQELDEKLRQKEDQVVRLLSIGHEKTQEAQQLFEEMEELRKENAALNFDLNQIKEAALSAIMDKDATITELTEKLEELQNNEGANDLKSVILDLQDKYRQLEDRAENSKNQLTSLIEEKDGEINELQEKLILVKQKHEERSSRLEQEIIDLEKHLEEVTALKDHQENLEEKYYHTEEKLRKTEKRLFQLEQTHHDQISEKEQALLKAESENQTLRASNDQLKELRIKLRQMDREQQLRKRQAEELKDRLEKVTLDLTRKMNNLQSQKKILSDTFNLKQQEIDRLRNQLDQQTRTTEPTLAKQKSIGSISPQKGRDQDNILVEKLKKQNRDLQETNDSLKKKIEEQTKELQQARQKLLQARGSQGANSEVNKLKLQIQEINSYIKKVENEMLIKKITHAENQNYWQIKEKKFKEEYEQLTRKNRRENSDLLQRIDRIKKLVPKDKKTDYYQSGFK